MIPVLRTPRLVLRPLVPADAGALFAFRSDPVEQKHNDEALTTVGQAHELVARLAAEHHGIGGHHWGLTLVERDVVGADAGPPGFPPRGHVPVSPGR